MIFGAIAAAFFLGVAGMSRRTEKKRLKQIDKTRQAAHDYTAPLTQGNAGYADKKTARSKGWL